MENFPGNMNLLCHEKSFQTHAWKNFIALEKFSDKMTALKHKQMF